MPVPARIFTPEEIADAHYSYVETDEPVALIAKRLRTSEKTLSRNIRIWGWPYRRQTVRREMAQPAPPAVVLMPPALTPEDEVAAADIETTVQREVAAIRMIVARLPVSTNGAAAERTARALATLTRTLQELARLRSMRPAQTVPEPKKNRVPTDPDEFLIELARRMDAFAAAQTGDALPDAGGGGVD